MGRKARHTARTGDGGAELRHKKRQVKEAERAQKAAELDFYDDPSENDESEKAESEGSEFGDEEEVLQLGESDDGESNTNSDSDEADEDDDAEVDEFGDEEASRRISKMDSKWGKSKKTFYSADTAEFEVDGDDEAARDEESAAIELQHKQAIMMDDEDFGFDEGDVDDQESVDGEENALPIDDEEVVGDQLADISMLTDDGDKSSIEQVKKDFSKLSKKDKLRIVNQTAPELLGLKNELETTVKELNEVVTPAILKLKDVRKRTKDYNTGVQYLVTQQNLMLNYIANISFYLLLRSEGKDVTDHPVLQHLLALKKQMAKLQPVDDVVNVQLHDLLTQDFPLDFTDDGLDKFINSKPIHAKRGHEGVTKFVKKQKTYTSSVSREEKEEAAKFYELALREKQALQKAKQQLYTHEKPSLSSSEEEEDSDNDDGTKRGASYEIIKNKGLKVHKSKINRNPRVKKRMQYRKAVIRRKGQVRDVRVGEAGRYGGETTGIKSNLTRSRKIRS